MKIKDKTDTLLPIVQIGWSDRIEGLKEVNMSFVKQTCSDAVEEIFNKFETPYIISGREIIIGEVETSNIPILKYGKNNGLFSLNRSINTENIITRLKAIGGSQNMPLNYLQQFLKVAIEWEDTPQHEFMVARNIMLPIFRQTFHNYDNYPEPIDYIDAETEIIEEYGIREGILVADDIFPTIEGATFGGFEIDEVIAVDEMDDTITNNEFVQSYFNIYVRDLGFNPKDEFTVDTPQVSMKNGYLTGYNFDIFDFADTPIDNPAFALGGVKYFRVKKNIEKDGNYALPNEMSMIRSGDRFVLLGISMPFFPSIGGMAYIENAENRLQARAEEYLEKYSKPLATYTVTPDTLYVEQNGGIGLFSAGYKIAIEDNDIVEPNPDYSGACVAEITIKSVSIRYTQENYFPEFSVVLSEDYSPSLFKKVVHTTMGLESAAVAMDSKVVMVARKAIGGTSESVSSFKKYECIDESHYSSIATKDDNTLYYWEE